MPTPDRTLEVPFAKGLEQKQDDVWSDGFASATNLVRNKDGALSKRLGYGLVTNVGRIPAQGLGGGSAATMQSGSRLASYKGSLVAVGRDTWTDAVWSVPDAAARPLLLDRTPEVYAYPYQAVAAGGPVAYAMDTAICNGYEVDVWVSATQPGTPAALYYAVFDGATGGAVVPPQLLLTTGANAFDSPQLTVCGTTLVLTWMRAGASNTVQASTLDCTQPWLPWSGASSLLGPLATRAYGTSAVVGDPTRFVVIAEVNTPTINIVICSTALAVLSTFAIQTFDSVWSADALIASADALLQGLAIRADSVRNEIAYAYAWAGAAGATTLRASVGIIAYTNGALLSTPVNVFAGSLPYSITVAANYQAPSVLALELASSSTSTSVYNLYLSPSSSLWDAGTYTAWLSKFLVNGRTGGVYGNMALTTGSPRVTWGLALWSRALPLNGIGYLVAYLPNSTQGSFFLLADDAWNDSTTGNADPGGTNVYFPLRLVGNIAPRLSSGLSGLASVATALQSKTAVHLALNPSASGGLVYQTLFALQSAPSAYGPARIAFDFASALKDQACELGDNLVLASACPSFHDGAQVGEISFPIYPVISLSNQGAGALPAGTYSYMAVYRWTDARGTVHQSARSVPATIVLGGGSVVKVTIGVCGFSARTKNPAVGVGPGVGPEFGLPPRSYASVAVYRTANGGTIFNEISAGPSDVAATLALPTVSVLDSALDTAIAGNPLCYGDGATSAAPGAILDDECPPAFQCAITHQARLFGIDGVRVWPSKALTTGAGVGFNEATVFSIDDGANPCTALASMDGQLIVFKSDRIFAVSGYGPADNGANNDFTPPARIASDTGCVDWRSVVSTQEGVYFMSPAGRKLLTRDLQVVPVPVVEAIDQANPRVTSALVHPSNGRVIWTQNTDDATQPRAGVLVKRDYVLDAWTSDAVKAFIFGQTEGFVSGVVANHAGASTYHALRADGLIVRERTTLDAVAYEDSSDPSTPLFSPFAWTSAWLKSEGLTGWSVWRMIRLTLRRNDAAAILVSIAYDYNPAPVDLHVFTAAQLAGFTTFLTQLELQPTRQRAEAMQISISDAPDSSTSGQSYTLLGLRIDYATEPGGYRTPVAQRG